MKTNAAKCCTRRPRCPRPRRCAIRAAPDPGTAVAAEMTALPVGRAQVRREGRSGLAILAFGALVESARKIAERLDATLVNMRFVKPLDEKLVHRSRRVIEPSSPSKRTP